MKKKTPWIKGYQSAGLRLLLLAALNNPAVLYASSELESADHADHSHSAHNDHTDHPSTPVSVDDVGHELHGHDHHAGADSEEPESGHTHDGAHGDHEEPSAASINTEQQQLANIVVKKVRATPVVDTLYAPGEIEINAYNSYWVSPAVSSLVVRRHAILGEEVSAGEVLVTLFSERVATAQTDYQQAWSEWQRVVQLGVSAVGGKRYTAARLAQEAFESQLLAYGLTPSAVNELQQLKLNLPLGQYHLVANIDGVVLSDDFQQGQRVDGGQPLMTLADESSLWITARLAPDLNIDIPKGFVARVVVNDQNFEAMVVQEAHTIDPHTRTRTVRLKINNYDHQLHAGLFAEVYFDQPTEPTIALPAEALMRDADGDWVVYVEKDQGVFVAQPVLLKRRFERLQEVKGVEEGQAVVVQGAFFVASEMAKSGFDPHNH